MEKFKVLAYNFMAFIFTLFDGGILESLDIVLRICQILVAISAFGYTLIKIVEWINKKK